MTEEEMMAHSVQSITQLDQDPDGEARALRTMERQCIDIAARYPAGHALQVALDHVSRALIEALVAYAPYLSTTYGSMGEEGEDGPANRDLAPE